MIEDDDDDYDDYIKMNSTTGWGKVESEV